MVNGKPHSYYRRTHGPDGDFHNEGKKKSDAEAWEKEGQKFSAWELITGCWRSKRRRTSWLDDVPGVEEVMHPSTAEGKEFMGGRRPFMVPMDAVVFSAVKPAEPTRRR